MCSFNILLIGLIVVVIIILLFKPGMLMTIIGVTLLAGIALMMDHNHGNVVTTGGESELSAIIGGDPNESRWFIGVDGNPDYDTLVKGIEKLGMKVFHSDVDYRRYVYEATNGYSRVREERDDKGEPIITLTRKTYENKDYPLEYELQAVAGTSIKDAKEFMDSLGLKLKSYHETRRMKWVGDGGGCKEIVIDTIPGLRRYVEIDCTSEEALKRIAGELGLKMENAHYGNWGRMFEKIYGVNEKWFNNDLDELTFETVAEKIGPKVVKNKEEFEEVTKSN